MGKNKQNKESNNKFQDHTKNQKNGESNNKSHDQTKNQKNGNSNNKSQDQTKNQKNEDVRDKSDKKNQCKEIVLKVYMHCEGCASQVSHCLRRYDGVEKVKTEIKDHKVIVIGNFDDPMKILCRVQKKFSKNAELVSPKPNPKQDEKDPQQKKENTPQIKTAVLKMNMHCEGCVHEIKRGIEKIKGIQTVEPDRSKSTVVVRGVMDPPKLVEKIKKKLGKHAELVSQNTDKDKDKDKDSKIKNNKNSEDGYKIFSYPPQYSTQHSYPSQMFSDENVHSCSIM